MPQEYKISHVKPNIDKETQEQRVDNYGNKKYYVLFEGEEENVPLSAKHEPKPGDTKFGEIVQGDYGKYFKSAKNPNAPAFGGGNKYDSDGQKQGMAIKSACDYVTKHSTDKLSPLEFAGAVEKYATALYNLELKKQEVPNSAAWEEARQKALKIKEEARLKEEAERQPVAPNGVEIEEIDTTPIDISDIPFN